MLLDFLKFNAEVLPDDRILDLSSSEWESMVELATRNGCAPLLYHRLLALEEGVVPTDILRQLHQKAAYAALTNKVHFSELSKVLQRCQEAGIQVIILKGTHLAKFVYKDVALRPMIDVDLLVRREDLPRVPAIFSEMGYEPSRPYWLEVELETKHHLPLFQKTGRSVFEVHWDLVHPNLKAQIDVASLWRRSHQVSLDGLSVGMLAPEDLLLHLCLHCCQDYFKLGLRSLLDISKTLDVYDSEIDWEGFVRRAFQWKASKCVYLTLNLAREMVGVDLPDGILESLQPGDFHNGVIEWAKDQMLCTREFTPNLLVQMSGEKPLWTKIRVFFWNLFPSRHEISQIYTIPPDSLRIYLYYFVRLKDLLVKGARSGGRLFRQRRAVSVQAEREASLINWLGID